MSYSKTMIDVRTRDDDDVLRDAAYLEQWVDPNGYAELAVSVCDEHGEVEDWAWSTTYLEAEADIRQMLLEHVFSQDDFLADFPEQIELRGTRRIEGDQAITKFDEEGYDSDGRDWMGLDRYGLYTDGWDPIAEAYWDPETESYAEESAWLSGVIAA